MRAAAARYVVIIALIVGASAVPTSPAFADAIGTTPVGGFEYDFKGATMKVPAGRFFTHRISGSDRSIQSEVAGVDTVGPGFTGGTFCNWRIDFQFQDDEGAVYETDRGPVSNTCDNYTFRAQNQNRVLPRYGMACALFFVNGTERARQCHNIVKPT